MGLLTRLVPEAAVQAETTEMAESLARGPRIAFHYMKRNLNAAQTASFADIVRLESYAQIRCRATQDYQEGVQAFAERRPPVFKGH
jgi:2-(1,2-epoxy-1,2-dihydrophenyl)acetyl-CoA isomerase